MYSVSISYHPPANKKNWPLCCFPSVCLAEGSNSKRNVSFSYYALMEVVEEEDNMDSSLGYQGYCTNGLLVLHQQLTVLCQRMNPLAKHFMVTQSETVFTNTTEWLCDTTRCLWQHHPVSIATPPSEWWHSRVRSCMKAAPHPIRVPSIHI